MEKIGEILLDSGVLIVGDLVFIKKIKQTPHEVNRQFVHSNDGKIYTQNIDFNKYTDILFDNYTVNELIAQGVLTAVKNTNDTDLSTENILNDLDQGFKQLYFENGSPGKAFAVLSEAGFFPRLCRNG